MVYLEVWQHGRWVPTKYQSKPPVVGGSDGNDTRLKRNSSIGPRIRGMKEVNPNDEGLSLEELQQLYGEKEIAK